MPVAMTRAMALEWGRHGINVNALCPGFVTTELNARQWESEAGQRLVATLPRQRVGAPEDLDGMLLLLASDASRLVNGSVITVDDGFGLA